ncbi:T9SS type A sorting domain-containing protein [Flavilitoribacter nigricans]|uniref:Secretion system C-terminal sorting domain-containing protein n=1 Tax=Flavilitoribacter nigricans (strain ATCC 23147 / DSM 23189 / NBRC 102662 / NCIMB 1420 / SS-2) TaxID=1122177 RepID=A0A2D0NHY6_FLAN2|nr:T9SS type A sorting domain-containing protein [Flavilitoribacter nigricans]PHN08124.1 hypothetical protein CRP01_02030 [Flavilitoribacter nigricans DSM 23189 = NBRC 102662]
MTSLIVTTKSKSKKNGLKQQFFLLFSLGCLLFLALTPQTIYAQCSAISSINFAANNPADTDIYWGDGSNAFIRESLEPQDYECFDVVPFFVELRIDPDAACTDYVVELPVSWLCNTTGQGGIGVTDVVSFQLNDASDPGSANLDGNEMIIKTMEQINGDPLGTSNGSCTLDAVFEVSGLDPGDVVIVRIDVLLDCDLTSTPTGNIQANLGAFQDIKILFGNGIDCGCDNLQGGAQTIPWKVGLPECEIACTITKNQDASCNGFSDGSATVNVTGAYGTVTYAWPGGQTTATVSNLAAGTYEVTVSDEIIDCNSTCMVTINEPPALNCSITKTSDVSCYGFSDGSATISGSGGTPPYSFNWGGADPTALSAGTYTATVTDANGCTSTCSVTILQPLALSCSITKTSDASCNGFNDGSATISGAGGTPPYSFNWGGADPNALAAGSYTATVTDANGCTSTCDVTIGQPSDLSCSITKDSDVSCYGFSDGSASISAAGGTAPYSFDWGGADPNALAAGSYTATVTDANGCTSTCSVTILEPPALTCSITKTSDVSCYGFSDGSATISGAGGTTPYSFDWGGANPNALAAGTYTATVTDANGCTSTCMVTIAEPPALSCSITKDSDVSCYGFSDGSASISGSGGTPPYSFNWGGANPNALAAGTYTATVTDANGCTSTCSVTILQPPALSCSISKDSDVSCYGFSDGSATVSGSGGTTPYSFNWGGKNPNALPAGTHTVTVTDANGCTSTCSVTISQPPPLSCSIINNSGVSEICLGESLDLSAGPSGGTPPYTYDWSSDGSANFSSPSSSSTTVSGFGLGTETITLEITDANGCVTTCTIDITTVRCVDECTWTPGFWKNHPEEICGLLGGNVTKFKGQRSCSGESQNIGFELCGTHYTLSASEISCLFNYSSSTRGRKTPPGCTPEVVAIAEHFAPYPNGETLLHHILAAKLNLIYNGASFGNLDVGDLVCVDEVNGVNVPNIFNGTPDASANEICAINFCLNGATSASQLSAYIKPLTAFNECNNTCGLPSQNPFLAIPQFTERVNTEMRVFPNPAKDQVNLQFNLDADRQISIRVMDMNGKLYRTMQIDAMQGVNTETIELDGLSSGLYLIQFTDGERVQTKRFIRTE